MARLSWLSSSEQEILERPRPAFAQTLSSSRLLYEKSRTFVPIQSHFLESSAMIRSLEGKLPTHSIHGTFSWHSP
jgi:hypothetical protein